MYKYILLLIVLLMQQKLYSQSLTINGVIKLDEERVSATVQLIDLKRNVNIDSLGNFSFPNLARGNYQLKVTSVGYKPLMFSLFLSADTILPVQYLERFDEKLDEVVITGTQKAVNRLESPVPVEIYTSQFLKKNPTPSLFDALQLVNGVRPQLNCSICNTGDIHINGLEGPYTMVMIDGMPIVSSLSTVYGLSGIPNALIDRIEVVKGPASSLYGSEAIGGLINVITKEVHKSPLFTADLMSTSYLENQIDLGLKSNISSNTSILTGLNYFKYANKIDQNQDGFTDVTLQDRISLFQKWNIKRAGGQVFNFAGRYLYEDRWGGDMSWEKQYRGGDKIYGESIYTKRIELLGKYQLPLKENLFYTFSYTNHQQDSRYGVTSFIAKQQIAFAQINWDKRFKNHDVLAGLTYRYTYYDDNTPATSINEVANLAQHTHLPGVFVQDELKINKKNVLLLGVRYDYNSAHGSIFTPRIAYKYNFDELSMFRFNAGTGFRVVNVFTEDHAALTGARTVILANDLKPEKSYNMSLNFLKRIYTVNANTLTFDLAAFYTYFNNRIVADYEQNVNEINYANLNGFAISKGLTLNFDAIFNTGLKINAGVTLQDVSISEGTKKKNQLLTERWMGTWAIAYRFNQLNIGIDYTGNIYGPMELPLLGDLDPRSSRSPVWSLQNIQMTFDGFKRLELYGGIKNLLNFKPTKNNPFLIARTNDPFDKEVQFDANGNALATPNNPYALTFDPSYIYAPNQGIRVFIGVRYLVK